MIDEYVTIVKISGKGAGADSMRQILRTTWDKMRRDAESKTDSGKSKFPDYFEWKNVHDYKGQKLTELPKQKSPEEIMQEAINQLEPIAPLEAVVANELTEERRGPGRPKTKTE